ncbi:hypothetical protein NH340_JMT05606 [Sarcoptes scabiei]|nr:hypothetical protein NH340_JMT05606 [Sarcoptes scabiei]
MIFKKPSISNHRITSSYLESLAMMLRYLSLEDQTDQITMIDSSLNHPKMCLLFDTISLLRLVKSIISCCGNYEIDFIEATVGPIAIKLIHLTILKEDSINEERRSNENIALKRLSRNSINLLLQCIDYLKPIDWQHLSIDHQEFDSIRNLLEQCVDTLLSSQINSFALKRFREIDSNKNGTILFGSAFHSVWNRDRIEFLAKDFDEIFSSVTLKLSDLSETRFVYAMNDEEFVDFLFQNIEKYFD